MKWLVLKSVLFVLLLLGIFTFLDPFFLDYKRGTIASVNSFYEASPNSVDMLMLGSSHLNKGINPINIEAETNLTTEMIVGSDLSIDQVHDNLLKALELQSPKVVVIETWPLIAPSGYSNNIKNRRNKDGDFSLESITSSLNSIKHRDFVIERNMNLLLHTFNVVRFHKQWTSRGKGFFIKESWDNLPAKLHFEKAQNIKTKLSMSQLEAFEKQQFSSEKMYASEDEKEYVERIIDLSLSHNFDLIFITVPVLDRYFRKTYRGFHRVNDYLHSLAAQHSNIMIADINRDFGGLDFTHILKEPKITFNQHLNAKGIEKTTDAFLAKLETIRPMYFQNIENQDIRLFVRDLENLSSDKKFFGSIDFINGQSYESSEIKNELMPEDKDPLLTIDGWMSHAVIDLNETQMFLVFKKSTGKIVVRPINTTEIDSSEEVRRRKQVMQKMAFQLQIEKEKFNNGLIKIYLVVRTIENELLIHDPWKWIRLQEEEL